MTTNTDRLGLRKHTTADSFRIDDYAHNWNIIDQYPGIFICTSTTRPTLWGAPQEGNHIYEKDTRLLWVWSGTEFRRSGGKGRLGSTARTADIFTTTTTFVVAVQTDVVVPAGGRDVQVIAEVPRADSSGGVVLLKVQRGTTDLSRWAASGESAPASAGTYPPAAPITITDPAPPAGAQTYSLQFAVHGTYPGTAALRGDVGSPIRITANEV